MGFTLNIDNRAETQRRKRQEQTRGILDAYRQEPEIPQGGISPEEYQSNAMFQPRSQADQSGFINEMLGAGNTLPQVNAMLGAMNPQEAPAAFTPTDITKAQKDILASHESRIGSTRPSLERFNEATNLIESRGGFEGMSGEDDTALFTFYSQMQRPGEAMNEGDVAQIMAGAGLYDLIGQAGKFIQGKGRLSDDQRARIYRSMGNLAESRKGQYDEIRGVTQQMLDPYQGALGEIMRPQIATNPYPIKPELLYTRDELKAEYEKRHGKTR